MNNHETSTTQPRRSSFQNKTLQYTLIAFFKLAAVLLVVSHNAVSSSTTAGKQHLLSVPVPPPRRQAAKGGLPPIPDFVKQKHSNDGHDEKKLPSVNEQLDKGRKEATSDSVPIPSFPLPSEAALGESASSEIILRPSFGYHRPSRNAVFAFAEGYDLNVYVTFIESLKLTNFTGDVVLAVTYVEGMKSGVEQYLKSYSENDNLRVIFYALSWECYKKSGVRILPTNKEGRGSTTNHGFSDCKIHGLYGSTLFRAEDPRIARPVATARYELYWIFSRQYHPTSSILIVDARDAYFQSNPFTFSSSPSLGSKHLLANQQSNKECRLDLFEENYEAVNIGKSQFNSRWVKSAYGHKSLKKISSKPVICSGSTMGTQHAIELYSMAMVAQFDNTKCKQVGCDQGFHNYLIYEGGLEVYLSSHSCLMYVHQQGDGAVNNLAAMRNSSLRSQGVLKSIDDKVSGSANDNAVVLNNDKFTASPVLHQFDRDDELKRIIRKRTSKMMIRWKSNNR
ncbi:hypothetical protein ACHAXR_009667 [Thalassiosira sp. AJA248-18]